MSKPVPEIYINHIVCYTVPKDQIIYKYGFLDNLNLNKLNKKSPPLQLEADSVP